MLVVVVALLGACKHEPVASQKLPSSRAASTGAFADQPQLAFVPADTPYVFATFKPVPIDYIEKMSAMAKPMIAQAQLGNDEAALKLRAIADEIGTFNAKRFEELGFSASARMVVYGLGRYPVFRLEIKDGDKVLGLVQRVATRWGATLPPPSEQDGRRVWRFPSPNGELTVVIALAKTELVAALLATTSLDRDLPFVLGTQKPAKSLGTAAFKAIAARDGFNDQGIGYVDTAEAIHQLIGSSPRPVPASCITTLADMTKAVPRIAIGYDDFSTKRISFGVVVELAPNVLGEAKALRGKLANLDRVLSGHPIAALAIAGNLDHARPLFAKIANLWRGLGTACEIESFVDQANEISELPNEMPAYLTGITGAFVSLDYFRITTNGPEQVEAVASVQATDTAELRRALASVGLDLQPDKTPAALPQSMPFKGHAAASKQTVAFAIGANSQSRVGRELDGTPVPAPLLIMRYDYARFFGAMPGSPELAPMKDMFNMLGVATLQLDVDERGVVGWMSLDIK
jgi:hypothetical protein